MPNPSHPIFGKAREESKQGYVQHVESNSDDTDLHTSDWHDPDKTLVSYSHGREINRNRSHPLLAKHKDTMNEEEMKDLKGE